MPRSCHCGPLLCHFFLLNRLFTRLSVFHFLGSPLVNWFVTWHARKVNALHFYLSLLLSQLLRQHFLEGTREYNAISMWEFSTNLPVFRLTAHLHFLWDPELRKAKLSCFPFSAGLWIHSRFLTSENFPVLSACCLLNICWNLLFADGFFFFGLIPFVFEDVGIVFYLLSF